MSLPLAPTLAIAGRVLFTVYFFVIGFSHLFNFREHATFIGSKGVPWPAAATVATIVMMGGGALLLLLNWHPRAGAALLFGIIFPAPFFLHHWWRHERGLPRLSELAHFTKDLSLAGAALLLLTAS